MRNILGVHTKILGLINVIWFTMLKISSIQALSSRTKGEFSLFIFIQLIISILIVISLFLKPQKPYLNIGIVMMSYLDLALTLINSILQVSYEHGTVYYVWVPLLIIVVMFIVCIQMTIKYDELGNIDWLHKFSGRYFLIMAILGIISTIPMSLQLIRF